MGDHIKDFGIKIECMVWECSPGQISANLLEIIKMTKRKAMGNFTGLMD